MTLKSKLINRFIPYDSGHIFHELRPGELLCDKIARDLSQGVSPSADSVPSYDDLDDDDFTVDPYSDIRTDPFELVEHMQYTDSLKAASSLISPDFSSSSSDGEVIMEPSVEPSHGAQTDDAS